MWVRVRGLLIMIRVLAPLLAFLAIWFATHQAINAVEAATESYRTEVNARVDNIRDSVSGATDALTTLGGYAVGVRDAVSRQVVAIRDIGNLQVPLPTVLGYDIPDIDVTLPGSAEVKRLTDGIDVAGQSLGDNLEGLTAVGQVPGEVSAIADETIGFVGSIRDAVVGWAKAIAWIVGLFLLVFVLTRLGKMALEFRRGWRMLTTGMDIPSDALAALIRRVAVLEERLANG